MNALPFIIAPLPIAAQLEMFGAIMSVWALYTGQSVWSAAFSVSDLESNRLAGIKGLNRSNLCTRPQVTRPAEVRSSAGIMIGRLSPPLVQRSSGDAEHKSRKVLVQGTWQSSAETSRNTSLMTEKPTASSNDWKRSPYFHDPTKNTSPETSLYQ